MARHNTEYSLYCEKCWQEKDTVEPASSRHRGVEILSTMCRLFRWCYWHAASNVCRKVLAHPSGTGSSSMQDYNRSAECLKSRKINRYDRGAGSTLGIDVLTLLQKGTKTGNRCRIMDLATPAGFNQQDFEAYFLKAFLATNHDFNCPNNLAVGRVAKYNRPGVEILSSTTLTLHLKQREKSIVDDIRTCVPAAGGISLAADTWTSLNKLAFSQLWLIGSRIAGR